MAQAIAPATPKTAARCAGDPRVPARASRPIAAPNPSRAESHSAVVAVGSGALCRGFWDAAMVLTLRNGVLLGRQQFANARLAKREELRKLDLGECSLLAGSLYFNKLAT